MTTAKNQKFRLDRSYRRPDRGRVVIGGSPLRVLTVADRAIPLLEELERDGSVEAPDVAQAALLERFVDLGVIHPVPTDDAIARARSTGTDRLTIVIPCLRGSDERLDLPPRTCRTIVVDDGSPIPIGPEPDVSVVRLDVNVGPGGARNAGLDLVTTPLVAFVDADVEIDEAELVGLLAWFDDPRVALVAPRIRAAPGAAARERFEAGRSPLDLGDEPARVEATTRVSYVPATVIVCRVEAVRSIGGFDEALRWGEDVDLVWRLREAGWRCRYEPSVTARHRTRRSMRSWLAQRFRYGTSAAPLARRHPGALAPVRMSGWSAATWAPVLAGVPMVGLTIGISTTIALVRKLRAVSTVECIRLAGLGHLYSGKLLANTLTRAWWPCSLAVSVLSRRARRVVVVAAVISVVLDRRRERPALDPIRYASLHVLDDLAYGTGVWVGAWRWRSLEPVLPSFEAWPPKERG